MTQAKPRFSSIEDYLNSDNGSDRRYELVNGEIIELPPESRLNQQIASFLFETCIRMGFSSRLLTIGVQIVVNGQKVTARQPDFVVLSPQCADALEGSASALITLEMPAPTLVVEVVSPGEPGTENYDRDYLDKRREYALRSIPEYWLIDPSRNVVTILTLNDLEYQEIGQFRGDEYIVSQVLSVQLTAEQILRAGR